MNISEKQIKLDKIAQEISNFKDLDIAKNCTCAVPGEGNPDAEIMFIGEAPGFHEDQQGRPFVGQAGKLLEKTLRNVFGVDRDQVYITNIVKFRPPENRDPLPNEIDTCRYWLDEQIKTIFPKIIVTLGRFSLGKFIPDSSISRVHGQMRFVNFYGHKIFVFPMYHPAAALRSGSMMTAFIDDFAKLKDFIQKSNGQKDVSVQNDNPPLIQSTLF